MANTLITVTTILALLSTSATLSVTSRKFYTNVRGAHEKYIRLWTEILVLRDVVDECHGVLDRVEAPQHVRESLISCFEMGEKVAKLAHEASEGIDSGRSRIMVAIQLVTRDDELTKTAAIFRERVVLLRDMCSE